MTKKLKLKMIILIVALSLIIPLSMPLAMMPTTDVTSYMYYIQQLKKVATQISEAKKLKSGTFDRLDETIEQMSGAYNMAKGLQGNVTDIQDSFDGIISGKLTNLSQYQSVLKEIENFTDAEDLVSIVWCGDEKVTPWKKQKIQRKLRQNKLKNIIVNNEERLEGLEDRMDKIKDLAKEIDSTENIKASQDLTNRILIEILIAVSEHLILSANYYEAQAMLLFTGEQSDEEFKKEQDEMQKKAKKDKQQSSDDIDRILQEAKNDNRTGVQRNEDRMKRMLLEAKKQQAKEKKKN